MDNILTRRRDMVPISSSQPETWDYEWDYLNGISMTDDGWTLVSSGTYSCVFDAEKGQKLSSGSGNDYCTLRRDDPQSGVMEITFYASAFSYGSSTRFCLSNGTKGVQIVAPGGALRLYNASTPANGTYLGVTLVPNQVYKIRFVLDGNLGCVYLDDVLLADNINISTIYYSDHTSVWSQTSGNAITCIQNVKMKLNRIV